MWEIMPKQAKKIEKEEKTKQRDVTVKEFDTLLDLVEELQKNLDFINDKLARVLNRMGLE